MTMTSYGRPRSKETIQRDNDVFEMLDEPKTIPQIAKQLGLTNSITYQSLNRLRQSGKVDKGGRANDETKVHVWFRK